MVSWMAQLNIVNCKASSVLAQIRDVIFIKQTETLCKRNIIVRNSCEEQKQSKID